MTRRLSFSVALFALLALTGCVERSMKIRTDPPDAIVVINDEEVGLSPVKFSFTWYGDYDIVLRKHGYETRKVHYIVTPPWWERMPFDLFAESILPITLKDEHVLPEYTLQPQTPPPADEVAARAAELRDRALYETVDHP